MFPGPGCVVDPRQSTCKCMLLARGWAEHEAWGFVNLGLAFLILYFGGFI